MKPTTLLLISMTIASFFSCKSTYAPETYEQEQLRFGTGGGFTGAVTEYCLLTNGHLYLKEDRDTAFYQINKIKKAKAKEIFSEAMALDIPTYKMKEPANMYKFITYMNGEGSNELVWSFDDTGSNKSSAEIAAFHSKLMQLINPVE